MVVGLPLVPRVLLVELGLLADLDVPATPQSFPPLASSNKLLSDSSYALCEQKSTSKSEYCINIHNKMWKNPSLPEREGGRQTEMRGASRSLSTFWFLSLVSSERIEEKYLNAICGNTS